MLSTVLINHVVTSMFLLDILLFMYRRSISGMSTQMSDRIRHLVHQFMTRTERFKEKTIQPPTPSTENKSGGWC